MVSFSKAAAIKPWNKNNKRDFQRKKVEMSIIDRKGISYCY